MKVALLGGSGRTGRLLLAGALASGHEVRVLVRDRAKAALEAHPALTVVEGDACVEADVDRTLAGTEAVMVALGHTPSSSADILARAATLIVRQARRQRVRRLIALTSGSVPDPADAPTLTQRALVAALGLFYRTRFDDALNQAKTIRASGLEYVLVRASRLSDEPGLGRVRAGVFDGSVSSKVTRADVAEFMLAQLHSDAHLGQMPFVTCRN